MAWYSLFAVYFIVWWLTLFAVLPWGATSAHEAGDPVEAGHAPSAPLKPLMVRKLIATTVISAVIFGGCLYLFRSGLVTLDSIPFFPRFRAV